MTTSTEINHLVTALAAARKTFKPFTKDKTASVQSKKGEGSSYSYKYGDLADLFDATTEALSDNGLTLSQAPSMKDSGDLVLVTLLAHTSGQFFRAEFPLHAHNTPQEIGSEITYLKRYMAGSMLGIQAETDDDGAAAQMARTATAQAPVLEGPLRVVSVKNQPTTTGKDRWRVTLSDGRIATTFKEKLATLAQSLQNDEAEVEAEVTNGTYGLDLQNLMRVRQVREEGQPPADAPPIDASQIPF
jgi:hypothetical protein